VASLHTARVEGKFIDSQLPAPTSKAELPLVEIGTAMVTTEPVGNNFCGVRTGKVLLYSPGLSTGRSLNGTSGGQCGQLKHEYKAGDVDHEDVHDD
jgi:hypothetical protein